MGGEQTDPKRCKKSFIFQIFEKNKSNTINSCVQHYILYCAAVHPSSVQPDVRLIFVFNRAHDRGAAWHPCIETMAESWPGHRVGQRVSFFALPHF